MEGALTINDSIHGSIALLAHEAAAIDHPFFQRLRRVKALGLLELVFPTARHSRFEHSIGACHLAGRLLTALGENAQRVSEPRQIWSTFSRYKPLSPLEAQQAVEKFREPVRLAALLHDIGHGPFSHASETAMPTRDDLLAANTDVPGYIRDALELRKKRDGNQANHEDYSLILAWRVLMESCSTLGDEGIARVCALKCSDIKPPTTLAAEAPWISLFAGLIDGELDCDRMDYLLRDSRNCGVAYGQYDLPRLLDGVILLKEDETKNCLGIMRTSLSAFEHFLFARFQMHAQIYTHKVDVAFSLGFALTAQKNNFVLPTKADAYAKLDDASVLREEALSSFQEDLDQRRWKICFESFSSDATSDSIIVTRLRKSFENGDVGFDQKEKPFRKPQLLDFPVVTQNFLGEFFAQKAKALSRWIADYNASFTVRRVVFRATEKNVKSLKEVLDGLRADFGPLTDVEEKNDAKAA